MAIIEIKQNHKTLQIVASYVIFDEIQNKKI